MPALTLRPYQQAGLDALRDALRRRVPSVLYVAPTGSGKTVLYATIARGAAARHNRVYILVHRREILEQTLRALHGLGVTSGQIAPGRPMTLDTIQTGMVQTIVRRLHALKRPDLIVCDEAHHCLQDNSWGRVIRYWSEVPLVGVSATPARLDGRGLGETFAEMIVGPSISQLVAEGYLSPPVIFRPPEEVTAEYHVKRGDFDTAEQQRVMSGRKIVGDVVSHYRKHLDGLPVIVSCVSIEHARLMASVFDAAGYRARTVWGDMPREEREAAIGGLGDGSVQVVTFCDLINEGVDVPVLAGAILLRRTMSLALYLQIVGRALRPFPGKDRAVILDHVGNYYLHGHVLEDRAWSLDSQKREKGERAPTTTTCPKCYGVFPGTPRRCPSCGFDLAGQAPRDQKTWQTIEAELVEAGIPDAATHAAFIARTQAMTPAERQKALLGKAFELARAGSDDGRRVVDALAQAVGYKRGKWAQFAWRYVKDKIEVGR
ncbi:MAG TPA: DEAD/DEAH box helicase [Coriobacteriia bacterium]|nr:DEAD/DEAH box helicase [Coriobacteriia bacterium]